jgi:lipopolysaccharide/colanic/teichoic acid biosynthesis glycosyltransferase
MFRVFEPETLSSFRSFLISSGAGAAIGIAIFGMFHPIWRGDLAALDLLRFYPSTVATVSILNLILLYSYRTLVPAKRYVLIGREGEFDHLLSEMRRKAFDKLQFVGIINPSSESLEMAAYRSDGILIADPALVEEVEKKLREIEEKGYSVEYMCNMAERILGKVPIELAERFRDYYEEAFGDIREGKAKRVLDVVVSVIALLVFSPVMLLIAVAILIESGRPVIFKQKRIGKGGRPFTMYKFRSLTEGYIDPNNPNSAIEERSTFVGKIIRRLRFDEIPQFWNVLKGDMSVVGPRPEMEEYHRRCDGAIPFYRYRLDLKPGITGWAQLKYKHTSDLDEYEIKTSYDLYYVKSRNILMDLAIILKTFQVILGLK